MPETAVTADRGYSFLPRALSRRLIIVFAVLLLPPTALSAYFAWQSFVDQKARATLQVRQFALLTAAYENTFFEDVREKLRLLSQESSLRIENNAECRDLLAPVLEDTPEFASLGLYNASGSPICGAAEAIAPAGARNWLRGARGFGGFAISDYTIVPDSPYPAIVAAQPVYDMQGEFRGMLAATIRLYWLSAFVREISLPEESVFFLIDGKGNVLADRTTTIGVPGFEPTSDHQPRATLAAFTGDDNARAVRQRRLSDFEVIGADGVRRVFSSVELPHGGVKVLFGMPAGRGIGWLEQSLINHFVALIAIWISGIGAAWLGARMLVTRWIRALHITSRAYAVGDYSNRRDMSRAPDELRDLGESLALMAERVEAREADLITSIEQKDVLLKEIHHRVKNNLQIVSSLLNIQGDRDGEEDPGDGLEKVRTQVRALALVHRHLYECDDLEQIDLGSFMRELCQTTMVGLAPDVQRISLSIDAPPFIISADRAIPIALLTVEALTNCLKHAFPDGRSGEIKVSFQSTRANEGTLLISDNGVGLPENRDGPAGLGFTLIEAFARQVNGKLSIEGPPGSTLRLVLQHGADEDQNMRGEVAAA